ncbi:hypothetical protein SVTN_18375 [Streptomyces vietnamensis]|uniref:Uncharacterized protein n=1 Tax=Streptomyces vietnamensis TaxID=362257 RepID=A0A0B5ICH7_9ACTN|nr:hypothetical protein SVTN_18375 [Streptomyces vietnamensis]
MAVQRAEAPGASRATVPSQFTAPGPSRRAGSSTRTAWTGRLPRLVTVYVTVAVPAGATPTARPARPAPPAPTETRSASARPPATPVYPERAVACIRSPRDGTSPSARAVARRAPGRAGKRATHSISPSAASGRRGHGTDPPGTPGSTTRTPYRWASLRFTSRYRFTICAPTRTAAAGVPLSARPFTVTVIRSPPSPTPPAQAPAPGSRSSTAISSPPLTRRR